VILTIFATLLPGAVFIIEEGHAPQPARTCSPRSLGSPSTCSVGVLLMACVRMVRPWQSLCKVALVMIALGLVVPATAMAAADASKKAAAQVPSPALDKATPESIDDLKAIQQQVKKVLEKVLPCTVCVLVGGGSGSGVLISEDGY